MINLDRPGLVVSVSTRPGLLKTFESLAPSDFFTIVQGCCQQSMRALLEKFMALSGLGLVRIILWDL